MLKNVFAPPKGLFFGRKTSRFSVGAAGLRLKSPQSILHLFTFIFKLYSYVTHRILWRNAHHHGGWRLVDGGSLTLSCWGTSPHPQPCPYPPPPSPVSTNTPHPISPVSTNNFHPISPVSPNTPPSIPVTNEFFPYQRRQARFYSA
jgi:hypothetical protein